MVDTRQVNLIMRTGEVAISEEEFGIEPHGLFQQASSIQQIPSRSNIHRAGHKGLSPNVEIARCNVGGRTFLNRRLFPW